MPSTDFHTPTCVARSSLSDHVSATSVPASAAATLVGASGLPTSQLVIVSLEYCQPVVANHAFSTYLVVPLLSLPFATLCFDATARTRTRIFS